MNYLIVPALQWAARLILAADQNLASSTARLPSTRTPISLALAHFLLSTQTLALLIGWTPGLALWSALSSSGSKEHAVASSRSIGTCQRFGPITSRTPSTTLSSSNLHYHRSYHHGRPLKIWQLGQHFVKASKAHSALNLLVVSTKQFQTTDSPLRSTILPELRHMMLWPAT